MIYVTLPPNFKSLKGIDGYFYNSEDDHLYSIKTYGVLRKMKRYKANHYNPAVRMGKIPYGIPYYNISIDGISRNLYDAQIKRLIQEHITQIRIGD